MCVGVNCKVYILYITRGFDSPYSWSAGPERTTPVERYKCCVYNALWKLFIFGKSDSDRIRAAMKGSLDKR